MDESDFHEKVDEILGELADAIETADEEGVVSAEYQNGVLTIEVSEDLEFVLNKHLPTKKIWMSSPESGASYFAYDEGEDKWLDDDGNELVKTLSSELQRAADIYIKL